MKRVALLSFLLLAPVKPLAPWQLIQQGTIDELFDRILKREARRSPEWATITQILRPDEQERLDGELTPATEARMSEFYQRTREALVELRKFNRTRMNPVQKVTASALEWQLDNWLRDEPFRDYRYIFEQNHGLQVALPQFLASTHPIRNEKDARNYLSRLRQLGMRMDEGIVSARLREKKGILPPREILTATIDQTKRFVAPKPADHLLISSFKERLEKVSGISTAARAYFVEAAEAAVKDSVYPAYHRVIALLESQLAAATDDAGWWRFPNGEAAYAQRLRSMNTTTLTAEEIHQLGLSEVGRIEKEIDRVLRKMGHTTGTLEERIAAAERRRLTFEGPDAPARVLARYEEIIRDAVNRSNALFDLRPRASVEVKRVPEFREANSPAFYMPPAPDGSRPGTFWVPLGGTSLIVRRTLAYHEAVPGHHFQIAIQQENKEMPALRSLGMVSSAAFAEGWGLYVERLAWEEGWYEDDLMGELVYLTSSDLFRARRLVVDTGIHAKQWTIAKGIGYGIRRSEVERYAVNPGQATSYKVGEQRILAMREKARRTLGSKFSLKQFHNVLLQTGNVPLNVLENVVDEYIQATRVN